MAMDELLQGLQVFQKGMSDYAISSATRDANEKLTQINTELADDTEKRIATSQLGQELAFRLTAAGANPGQIDAVSQRLSPSAGQIEQQRFSAEQAKSSQKFNAEQASLDRQARREDTLLGMYGKSASDNQLSKAQGKFGGVQLKQDAVYNEEDAKIIKKAIVPAKNVMGNVVKIQDVMEKSFVGGSPMIGKDAVDVKKWATFVKSDLRGEGVLSQTMGAALSKNEEEMLDIMIEDPEGWSNRLQRDPNQREAYKNLLAQVKDRLMNKLDAYNYELEPGGKLESELRTSNIDPRLRKESSKLGIHNDPVANALLTKLQAGDISAADKNKIKSALQKQYKFPASALQDF